MLVNQSQLIQLAKNLSDIYLDYLAHDFDEDFLVNEITVDGQVHGVEWPEDENEDIYALVGCNLAQSHLPVYAEVEDGTFGKLQGIRIYPNDAFSETLPTPFG